MSCSTLNVYVGPSIEMHKRLGDRSMLSYVEHCRREIDLEIVNQYFDMGCAKNVDTLLKYIVA